MIYEGKSLSVSLSDGNTAELNFNRQDASVNKFDTLTLDELQQAVVSVTDSAATGLIVTSNKPNFIVGADISEINAMSNRSATALSDYLKQVHAIFNSFEDLPIPTVAAIDGYALGGGLEMALVCDYRVVSTTARLGLPEVKLGIYPGYGGTVRLPRLIGFDNAVRWIASGSEQTAEKALADGVADVQVEAEWLREASLNTLQQCIDGVLDYKTRREEKQSPLTLSPIEQTMAFSSCKAITASQAGPNYPAPLAAVTCMEKAAGLDRDEALEIETAGILKLMETDQVKALSGIFLNDQLVNKKATNWAQQTDALKSTAVLGAGIMGGGIAYQTASKGIPVIMKDVAQAGLDSGLAEANKLLSKRLTRGRITPTQMGEVLNRIKPGLTYAGFENVDLVVEAVVENSDIKQQVLAELENSVTADTIVTSNTSTISISLLAENLERPENFCGMHFFNPVHVMPLVEVIRGKQSSDAAISKTVAYANAIGKKAIVVNDCPGFLVNRILSPYFNAFVTLLKEGADFQSIDRVMEKWGMPMGPAYLTDVVGIDTATHAAKVMAGGFPAHMQLDFKSANEVLFEAKRYGQKNGSGFYNYELDKKGKPKKLHSEETYQLLKPHVGPKTEFSSEDIVARLIIPMCIEMARCLDEEIVESPAEADMALIYGVGFPAFRGGLCRWMDSLGMQTFCEITDKYAHLGKPYEPTASMRDMAANTFKYYL